MKGFWIGFGAGACVGFFVLTVIVLLLAAINGVSVVSSGPLSALACTNSAGGLTVKFGGEHGDSIIFFRAGQTFTMTQAKGEVCMDSTVSPDGKVAALLMYKDANFLSDYGYVLKLDFTDAALTNCVPHRLLTHLQLNTLLSGGPWHVDELYKYSPSEDRVLIGVRPFAPGHQQIYWYNIASNTFENP